ncbi:DNA polymerase [Streptomyces uncialis]|uniref:DNA polymerase I n=1 Tax=Streptomyces uncialis TaxID=1048205 RepID=A0A1Q4VC60_9ACTN|nr:DNA polymerase [Streptomyces uncialis]OKH95434.1 DNA polymerase [Streptomyces uncialis]
MKVIEYALKGEPVTVNVVETPEDLPAFRDFVESNPVLGFDTETTGLEWWSPGFHCRLAQFGNATEAFVLPVELGPDYSDATRWALRKAHRLIAHNGTFDMHVSERCVDSPLEVLAPRILDTKLLAHLVDPRAVREAGPGLKLEELIKFYVDPKAAEEVKGSIAALAKKYKVKKEEIWSKVELFDPDYLLYAGMDPVWAYRLFHILLPKVPARSLKYGLVSWEHRLAHIMAKTERTGYLLDESYARARISELRADQQKWETAAATHGVENVNSNQQLIDTFTDLGVKLKKRTKPTPNNPHGQFAMDDDVLSSIGHPLAEAVVRAKKAGKWRKTWFERAIKGLDENGRVHGSVNSCQARTARMTVTGAIPALTFPAGDGYVRGMFLADKGEVSVSIDFSNMELRVMAAASGDPVMLEAFRKNEDLHNLTAIAAFGPMPPGVEKHPMRKAGKGTNFTVCFGGGWKAVSDQWGISPEDAKKAVKAFWGTYTGVKRFADKLQREARRTGYIYTATGRRLPVDRDRAYAALNYYIQSSARDITARAVIELDRAGYTPWIRLVIHDEIVFSFPRERAAELTEKAARIMEMTFKGLLIPADGEIGEQSWGSVLDLENSKH